MHARCRHDHQRRPTPQRDGGKYEDRFRRGSHNVRQKGPHVLPGQERYSDNAEPDKRRPLAVVEGVARRKHWQRRGKDHRVTCRIATTSRAAVKTITAIVSRVSQRDHESVAMRRLSRLAWTWPSAVTVAALLARVAVRTLSRLVFTSLSAVRFRSMACSTRI